MLRDAAWCWVVLRGAAWCCVMRMHYGIAVLCSDMLENIAKSK